MYAIFHILNRFQLNYIYRYVHDSCLWEVVPKMSQGNKYYGFNFSYSFTVHWYVIQVIQFDVNDYNKVYTRPPFCITLLTSLSTDSMKSCPDLVESTFFVTLATDNFCLSLWFTDTSFLSFDGISTWPLKSGHSDSNYAFS